jgi:lipoprotein-anchoring transpeptidase ErfK/SrfK
VIRRTATELRAAGLAVGLALTVLLAACSGGDSSPEGSGGPPAQGGSNNSDNGGGDDQAAPVRISTTPADGARDVAPGEPVTVRAEGGTLTEVTLKNPAGRQVKGAMSADRTTWTSAEPLGYDRRYALAATASGGGGPAKANLAFTTVKPAGLIYPSFFPAPSLKRIGVGQPLAVIYDKPPADRAAAERALTVKAVPAQEGAWNWWDNRTLHYRPKQYWKAGTKITLAANVYGVHLGNKMYGETDRTLSLTVGPAKIATVNDRTHMMTVTIDGKKVRTIPVSMGRSGAVNVGGKKIDFITASGVYVAQEKYRVKRMNSATFGLPSNYSLGYDSQIPLAVRISNGGVFVHSAPWSVADQGRRNVSHGCININPQAAKWFYQNFSYGDVVVVQNTSTKLAPTDGFGDWNISWAEWLKGSALR